MKRRKFIASMGIGVAAVELALLGSCTTEELLEEDSASNLMMRGKPPKTITRNLLKTPPTVAPGGLTLNAAPHVSEIGGGDTSAVWAFNGSFPGPTIRANSGDHASITFNNFLNDESIVHWHGMLVNHENDGHPIFAVSPGDSYPYDFNINQRATLNWYHPHPHGKTGEQVNMGLAGAFIINDTEEAALNLPSGNFEVPLIIRDVSFNKRGDIEYKPRNGGFVGKTFLVNGTKNPYIDVQRAVYRFRVLNGSNARIYNLSLSNGDDFTLIGNDGGLLGNSHSISNIMTSPGERLDILVDFREVAPGTVMLHDETSGWDLLEFKVADSEPIDYNIPTTLSTITPLSNPVREREFSFDGMSKINRKLYSMNRIDWEVPFNKTELLRLTTNGNAPHPVHIHGAYYQVISRTGGRGEVFPWEHGWKDTVLLEDNETVEILIRFDSPEVIGGTYLMHCHKLEHEDMGMMANFKVV